MYAFKMIIIKYYFKLFKSLLFIIIKILLLLFIDYSYRHANAYVP